VSTGGHPKDDKDDSSLLREQQKSTFAGQAGKEGSGNRGGRKDEETRLGDLGSFKLPRGQGKTEASTQQRKMKEKKKFRKGTRQGWERGNSRARKRGNRKEGEKVEN